MNTNHKSGLTIILSDLHSPLQDKKAFRAIRKFIQANRDDIDNLILLGDNQDFQNLSRHTENKPGLRQKGGIKRDFDTFSREILDTLESDVQKSCKRIIFEGNHENWAQQWLESHPEFDNLIDWAKLLRLKERGWHVVPQGHTYKVGKVLFMHGDQNGSGQYVAKKMVESNCCTCVSGHVHTYSVFTKCSEGRKKDKWIGVTLPCLTETAPSYAKGSPNRHIVGFGILESFGQQFNLYVPIIVKGAFSYAGVVYGRR
jgi:predicted phosphodiesterase